MIGGHHDESVLLGGHLAGLLDSRRKLGGVLEGSPGVGLVVGHVDAGTLDEKEESLLVATQDLDGRLCELTQRGIRQLAALPVPITVVGQVIIGKETEEIVRVVQIHQAETLATPRQREIICRYVPSEIPELNGNERH